jgi:hypothetical protein
MARQQMLQNKKIGTMKTSKTSLIEAMDRWRKKRLVVTQPLFYNITKAYQSSKMDCIVIVNWYNLNLDH